MPARTLEEGAFVIASRSAGPIREIAVHADAAGCAVFYSAGVVQASEHLGTDDGEERKRFAHALEIIGGLAEYEAQRRANQFEVAGIFGL
jgi:succinyl-CoA synthetase alpha subunit